MSDNDPRPPERTVSVKGIVIGAVVVPPLVAIAIAAGAGFAEGAGITIVAVAVVVTAFVLVGRDDPFQRGIGTGMLIMLAGGLLVFGTCLAIVTSAM